MNATACKRVCPRSAASLTPLALCCRPRLLRKGALVVLTLKVKATRGFTESRCAEVAEAQRMKLEGLLEALCNRYISKNSPVRVSKALCHRYISKNNYIRIPHAE